MTQSKRGHEAEGPRQIGSLGWLDITKRARRNLRANNIGVLAGGVAFYTFLALFPGIAALITIYGMVLDPEHVESQVQAIGKALPDDVEAILLDQMSRVATGSPRALGWGILASLLFTLWSANRGTKSLIRALNVVYGQSETRGLVRRTGLTLLLTLAGILALIVTIALIVALPLGLHALGLGATAERAVDILRWPILITFVLVGLAVVYRFGPDRRDAKWRWITPGAVIATLLLGVGSFGFSVYVESFGNFHETYGALGAVAILLLWFHLSAFAILLGAQINAEAERQTEKDSTTGPSRPMGERGATVADTMGESPA